MKRLLLSSALAATLSLGGVASAETPRVTEKFTPTATGMVLPGEDKPLMLLDVKDALAGAGAASLTVTRITGGFVARGLLYDSEGTLELRLVLSIEPATKDGSSPISGRGEVITGTGAYGHARGRLEVSGARSAAGIDTLKIDGRVRHDQSLPNTRSGRGQ
jgi:hypothetical protein